MNNMNFTSERNIRLAISSYCNLNCVYCGGHKGFSDNKRATMEDFRRDVFNGYRLSFEEIKTLLYNFKRAGFTGVTLTGGEPLLNKDWYRIIQYAKELGFKRREITTNGVLLGRYIKEYGYPIDLTLIKISLDTIDSKEFYKITGCNAFDEVVDSIKLASKEIVTRANRVVLKSELKDIDEYIKFCKSLGISEINLLDLVYYPNREVESEKPFFEKEYIDAESTRDYLEKTHGYNFERNKYGYKSINGGLKIIVKDSNLTLRDEDCKKCPIYCQEGKFTTRIGTDGNITMCPDYYCQLPSIDGKEVIKGNDHLLKKLYDTLNKAEECETMQDFLNYHDINLEV